LLIFSDLYHSLTDYCKERKINKEICDFYRVPVRFLQCLKKGEDFTDEEGNVVANEKLTLPAPPSRSYAFCTDTRFSSSVIAAVRGVDLLYHEATFLSDREELACRTFHSTAGQAAIVAREANVGKLIIGHFSSRYKDLSAFLTEARGTFGNSELAEEGKVFGI
jgi:ribonuclease Z